MTSPQNLKQIDSDNMLKIELSPPTMLQRNLACRWNLRYGLLSVLLTFNRTFPAK
jgi:hypothetical protein